MPFENAILFTYENFTKVEKNIYRLKFGTAELQDIQDWKGDEFVSYVYLIN